MAPDRSRISYLLNSWRENRCTKAEFDECLQYFAESQDDPVLNDWMEEEWELLNNEVFKEKNYEHLFPNLQPAKIRRIPWLRIVAAASVLLLLSIGYKYFHKTTVPIIQQVVKKDVQPGGNKAILTLGNGSKIILDSAHNGSIALQGNTNIIKTDSGKLSYLPTPAPQDAGANRQLPPRDMRGPTISYNTLSTPRGGQYQLALPDGTRVWLNAASSITYPTAFNGNDRSVEISGEAYFEVTKDKSKPFHVKLNGMEVTVLGTHFNINAYTDEKDLKTTLLEGAVNVTTADKSMRLAPNEQALVRGTEIKVEKNVDVQSVIAWKTGFFEFDQMDLPTVMRQVSRWYDVDIVYESNYPDARFGGRISRNLKLSEILQLLETSGVHFNVENKKLTIIK